MTALRPTMAAFAKFVLKSSPSKSACRFATVSSMKEHISSMMRLINKPSLTCRNCQILSRSHFSTFSTKHISSPAFNGQTVLPVRFVRKYKGNKGTDYTVINYAVAMCVTMLGVSYAAVPLYKKFCQMTGLGGRAERGHDISLMQTMKPIKDRTIHVEFIADKESTLKWNFRPMQNSIAVVPGETALAFFKASNPTDKPIIGVSTYNVLPYQAAVYFNKIQCFCFEEQRLNPHEEVELPVFFFIDPEYDLDINLMNINNIVLSYIFYEAKEGEPVPLPSFMQSMDSPVNHARARAIEKEKREKKEGGVALASA